MRRLLVIATAVAAVLSASVLVSLAPGAPAAACPAATAKALIGGKRVCLRAGQKCVLRFNGQYRRYGFVCKTGRLTRRSRWVSTDLGTLGGRQSWAMGINERGQIVGRADTRVVGGVGAEHAFLWQSGKMIDLDTLGDPYIYSVAVAINESGQVVVNTRQTYPSTRWRAFLWDQGVLTEIDGLGGKDIQGTAINERGQIIGSIDFKRAFVWQNGVTTDLGGLGGTRTGAAAINDSGQIVGGSETAAGPTHAFLWQNGKMSDLGTLGGAGSGARAINARGWVVGSSEATTGKQHAFLFGDYEMVDLGTLGRALSQATAINDQGQIIGSVTTASGDSTHGFLSSGGGSALRRMTDLGEIDPIAINERGQVIGTSRPGYSRALLWEGGVLGDLGTLGGPSIAAAINERDQIVGSSDTRGGATHAVLWTLRRGT